MQKRTGNNLHKLVTAANLIASYAFFAISFLIPKSKHIWIFMGWHRNTEREIFADNSKYFYLYCREARPEITAVWISRDRLAAKFLTEQGIRAYYRSSLPGIYYSLRAGFTFIDAFFEIENWRWSGGSKIIQLWHGKGMKKTGHDSDYSLKRYRRALFPQLFVKFNRLIASSPYTAKLMASTFKASPEKISITGLPRNDTFFRKIKGSEIDSDPNVLEMTSRLRNSGAKKIWLYAPTFRPNGTNPLEHFDFTDINSALKNSGQEMILSLHPKFAATIDSRELKFSNIHYIKAGYDLYPLLPQFDGLITDYSSLYVDFLLLDRPLIFFTYDLTEYKQAMGLHDDFERLTPGPHPQTIYELGQAIVSDDHWDKERQSVKKELFTYNDGNSSERILKIVLGQ